MIIDAHTFVHRERDGFGTAYDATLEHLLAELDLSPVDKALLLPVDCDCEFIKRSENAYVAECCNDHPDKFIGFASVHPFADGAVAAFEEAITGMGLKGLKLHPRFQGFAANDDRIVPLVEKAAEFDVPIAIDCQLWKPTPLVMQLPFNIDELCKKVPEAKVILCHAGGWRFLDVLAVAKTNDNVYLDLSLTLNYFHGTPFEDQFIFVLKQIGAHRLIYGSDHPQETLASCYERARTILESHGFADEQLDFIFGKTVSKLVGLDE